MEKERRHRAIINLLNREVLSSQEKLRKRLRDFGFGVTQATLSRDLKELGVVKTVTRDGSYKYTSAPPGGSSVLSCEASGNLIVLKTEPGMAPAVAYRVDAMNLSAILGTVAGEDTLLVIVSEEYNAKEVRNELWRRIKEA
ncbi:MAG TPA: arginine repressor [Acidobacteriota bacterium]|nr:arginine repressor [Acidobacteriota bacterium]